MSDKTNYSDAILQILSNRDSCFRNSIALELNVSIFYKPFVNAIKQLKSDGKIIETWSPQLGSILLIAKAPSPAQDAPEEAETGIGSTTAAESGTGQARPVEEGDWNTERRAVQSVAELVEKYQAMREELVALRNHHRRLFDDHMALKKQRDTLNEAANTQAEAWNALVVDREAYIALKEKLRGMLDE